MRRPQFIAAQARHATGPIGWLIAAIMARETRGDNFWAIESLAPKAGQHVLDIGTGHGSALAELAARTRHGLAVGIDPSQLMVEMAAGKNAAAIQAGRIKVVAGNADALPFPDGTFDGVMAAHVLYFWPDLAQPLAEIARVLKPGGRLVLLFRVSGDPRTGSFPSSIYRFRSVDEVKGELEHAGFLVEKVQGQLQGERMTPAVVVAHLSQ